MKTGIHPTYNKEVQVTCACGNTFVTGSTTDSIQVEICSNCHPFFTGTAKLLDAAGRVDRFKARLARRDDRQVTKKVRTKTAKPTAGPLVEDTELKDDKIVEQSPSDKEQQA